MSLDWTDEKWNCGKVKLKTLKSPVYNYCIILFGYYSQTPWAFYTPFFLLSTSYLLLPESLYVCLCGWMLMCLSSCYCELSFNLLLFLVFTQCLYTEAVEVLYSQTFCIIIVKKWFYSMASVPFTCPIGCIHLLAFNCVWCLLWRCMYLPYIRQLQWFCLIWIWWPSHTLHEAKSAWKMSLYRSWSMRRTFTWYM